jgi:hypothetical protein
MGAGPSSSEQAEKLDNTPQVMQSSEACTFFTGSWRDVNDEGDATSRVLNLCEDGMMNITTHSEVPFSLALLLSELQNLILSEYSN